MQKFFITLLIACMISKMCAAQTPSKDSLVLVEILKVDRFGYQKKDSLTELELLAGNVAIKQGNTYFYADSAVHNKKTKIVEAFGNVHINDNDSVNTYSQYLIYHTDTRVATLKKKVRLTDSKATLFTEELEYDMVSKIGNYRNGGRVVTGTSTLTSREGTYFSDIKDVHFRKDVVLIDPQYKLRTDSLLYNTSSQIATFITRTIIEDSTRNIVTKDGYYDMKNKYAYFGMRPVIRDGTMSIIANESELNDVTGINKFRGNAVFVDSTQGVIVIANYMEVNRADNSFFATNQPLMILKQEADSIYITADTLYSGRISQLPGTDTLQQRNEIKGRTAMDAQTNDTADRYFQAYHHVRIFSDSLQAVSDSLFYSGSDSIFQLFNNPIVWANNSQLTGDTIYLYTKNKKADRLFVFENALAINKTGENMFNQLRGNRLNGFFTDGVIDYMRARGNAESIYYVTDDDNLLVGINKSEGEVIDLRWANKQLNRVVIINDAKGTLSPPKMMSEADKTLRGFRWEESIRPKTKFDLFGN
ncbi:MAG TPA: OstA-like protein [Flavitalea sp.]|nr:OstA-like protein [Flavitalea sp.]